ncbi:class I adenylate-forming enzyme family protein [Rhodococcus sp. T7]|uniref:class I adenylate-forming enzyme family protein n=1 Tax=Rhodococcus sp. T7 TaxID=627444 RepID=UPI0013CB3459|nr:class I adenylate-forming enzyme family protein [Rhodococcus sp. T7]KAF0957822.1 Long-chain-fatty-acid--CoA ligase [Rhodococcus sp. T7]KAF0961525.1 Long-chain-fatty-acid--CoA ligase [Rhodococcus sp. T7]
MSETTVWEQGSPAEELLVPPPTARTLPELLDACAAATPAGDALVSETTRLTYAELAAQSQVAARVLHSLGIREDDTVALMAPNIPEWIPVAFGAMRCGARVDAFNTWAKAYDLDFLLRSSGASVLVMVDRVRGTDLVAQLRALVPELDDRGPLRSNRFPNLRHVLVIGEDYPAATSSWADLTDQHATGNPIKEPSGRGERVAYVLYTSGSTSTPKAVPLSHRDLVVNAFHIGERMGLGEQDRVWLGSPLFWSYGCANAALATMTHRACLVLQEQFTPGQAVDVMQRENVTAAYLLPAMIDVLATQCAEQMRGIGSLRTGLTIGRPDTVQRAVVELGVGEICNIYGSTETYGNCCVTDHRMPLADRMATQGHPLPGVAIRLVDEETGAVLPVGQAGEAQVRGRITPGYLNDDAANSAAFTSDGWFRTGDRLVLHPDGTVSFVDRATDMIKVSGINVSPAEVESFLAEHPDVREVLVVGAPHPSKDEVAIAFVIPCSDRITPEELTRYCKERIAGYKVPWLISFVTELPRTDTGKIARRLLKPDAVVLVDAALAAERAGSS